MIGVKLFQLAGWQIPEKLAATCLCALPGSKSCVERINTLNVPPQLAPVGRWSCDDPSALCDSDVRISVRIHDCKGAAQPRQAAKDPLLRFDSIRYVAFVKIGSFTPPATSSRTSSLDHVC